MSHWTELQFRAANYFIYHQVRQYGRHLDETECMQEGWRAFLTARRQYPQVAGCCSFSVLAERLIWEALEQYRIRRNRLIGLESPLSLDMQCGESCESVGNRYFRKTGDCSNSVALWDFAQRQGDVKHRILRQLYFQLDDQEIIEANGLYPEEYYALLEELQAAFEEWQAI